MVLVSTSYIADQAFQGSCNTVKNQARFVADCCDNRASSGFVAVLFLQVVNECDCFVGSVCDMLRVCIASWVDQIRHCLLDQAFGNWLPEQLIQVGD